ncbi:TonB-dependent hemoglobin/transferrin/lactoferrin family receptor [Sphingomonas sp.]|uniref:TonB-dependent hemoglobin/transferrin/lactoferrin family receptor n=1 Tax=Sphingomonas sp. TaxID=28214 RepID=UPI002BD5A5DD|nr:TonB-dependent hemoglobin/transferrin/lactoferrin family receptor [Sphingomonas sp.]HWK35201.1 TonB-dependent hemoglobin/transferrin/lactoferrin family receptor [Sphingomonas sp.]
MTIRSSWMIGGCVAAIVLAGPAFAQASGGPNAGDAINGGNDQDQTITVTAARMPVAVEDAPATVTVIDAERIADELATNIKDLVRFEPGISVTRQPVRFGAALGTTGRAGNEGFNIRGIGGNRVLMQVDGVRVPDGFSFGAQSTGRGDYVDIGLVKSVEILRGPASALYGSDGLAGAVSFTTADPADFLTGGKSIGGVARAAYASASNEFSETAIVAGRSGNWSAMAAYTRRDFHELDNKGTSDVTGSLRTTPNPQDGHSNAALGRIVYQAGGHRFRLTGEYLDNYLASDVLSGLSSTVELLQGRDTGERKRVAFDWTWDGAGLIQFARLAAYWQDADDVQFTDEDRTPAADRERLNTFENRVYGGSGELRLGFETGGLRHRLVFGGDISSTRQQGLRDGVVPPAGETYPTRAFPVTNYMLAGLFVADEVTAGPLTLYPALRFDAYDLDPTDDPLLPTFAPAKQHGSRLSPKIGAVLKLTPQVRLFANYAQGFKAPEPSQVNNFFENPPVGYISIPNPNLRPERSESYEGGARFTSDLVSVDLTGFQANYSNFIEQVETTGLPFPSPATPWIYQWVNLGRVRVSGAEARIVARPAPGVNVSVAASYSIGDEIDSTGAKSPLESIDPFKLVTGLGYDAPGRAFGGRLSMTYVGEKEQHRTASTFRGDERFILDLTAYARITPAVTLRGGVFNITDQKYWLWSDIRGLSSTSPVKDAYTQPGRNGSVSLSIRF